MSTQDKEIPNPPALKKDFGNGYRKPIADEDGLRWCNCTNPRLTSPFTGRGQAFCMKCKTPWYN